MMFSVCDIIYDFLLLVLVYFFLVNKLWKTNKEKLTWFHLTYLFFCAILYFTLMPISKNLAQLSLNNYQWNLIPFVDIYFERPNAYLEIYLNILLFIPFAFCLHHYHPLSRTKMIVLLLLISVSIETIQPILSSLRTADITDIFTNVFGGYLGYLLATIKQHENNK